MARSGESAYVYAKASGMLAKSFVGERASKLFGVRSLSELWALIFDFEIPAVPEVFLAKRIEQEAEKRFLNEYMTLLSAYSSPPGILIALLRFYDYDNLKDIAAALCLGRTEMPELADIGSYSMLNYKKWPDLAGITRRSPVSWYKEVPDIHHQHAMDLRLDREYIQSLWESVRSLPAGERMPVEAFLKEEISLDNILWALRLRVYYGMPADEVRERLVAGSPGGADVLSSPAAAILDKALDSYADWENWKYADFLNPHEEGVVWEIDPRWVQQAAKIALHKKARSLFHREPSSAAVLFFWFRIKQYELNCIRTVAEGLRLDIESSQMEELAGVHTQAVIIR